VVAGLVERVGQEETKPENRGVAETCVMGEKKESWMAIVGN
jgi:hypothetical protein